MLQHGTRRNIERYEQKRAYHVVDYHTNYITYRTLVKLRFRNLDHAMTTMQLMV